MIPLFVMRGLDPRIHDDVQRGTNFRLDCQVKPGNDEVIFAREVAR